MDTMDLDPRPSLRRAGSGESTDTVVLSATESISSSFSSVASSATSRGLLFGEIPSISDLSSATSYRRKRNVCHLVLSSSPAFLRLWHIEECRDGLLSHLDRATLADFRHVCHDFSSRAAPYLFDVIGSDFKSSSFTRPSRITALQRIGEHARTFTFSMPHTAETVLPPLVDPMTGAEQDFVYTPQVHKPTTLIAKVKEPKYGSWELTDLLIRQYPPLFHAATNVPAFIQVLESIPNLEHLKISCPDADLTRRYSRGIVDFALMSLRIAVEKAPLPYLDTLSLVNMHPTGLLYLQPLLGLGSTQSSSKRWLQIQKLSVRMDSFPAADPETSAGHLKLLHAYLGTFMPSVKHLAFYWNGDKGPNPFSLDTETCFKQNSTVAAAYSHPAFRHAPGMLKRKHPSGSPRGLASSRVEVTQKPSVMQPVASEKGFQPSFLKPLTFPCATHLIVENVATSAKQLAEFLERHKRTLVDLCLDDISLQPGNWDDALEPLTSMAMDTRRRMLSRDSPLFLSSTTLSSDTPTSSREMSLFPPTAMDATCQARPVSIRASSVLLSLRPESMDVPVMLVPSPIIGTKPGRIRLDFVTPTPVQEEPIIEGPLLAPESDRNFKGHSRGISNVGVPFKRWFSKGKSCKPRLDDQVAQVHVAEKRNRIFKHGFLGWK